MVVTFALGMVLWSIAFIISYRQTQSIVVKGIILFLLAIMILPSVGLSVQGYIKDELLASNELRKLIRDSDIGIGDEICVEGFGSEVLLRTGNVKGLVLYETKNLVTVTECYKEGVYLSSNQDNTYILKPSKENDSSFFVLAPIHLNNNHEIN